MQSLPLKFETGHLYLTLDGDTWMFDTGSPTSFGATKNVTLGGEKFKIPASYMGTDAAQLSDFADHPTCGLLGADVLNQFDVLIDIDQHQITFSKEETSLEGTSLTLDAFMGIPLLDAQIGGGSYRMFFDTGAQVSYFQHRLHSVRFHRRAHSATFIPVTDNSRRKPIRSRRRSAARRCCCDLDPCLKCSPQAW